MKKALLAFLTLAILIHAPWRLMALAAETLFVQPGATRVAKSNDKYWDYLALEARLIDMGWQVKFEYEPKAVVGFFQTARVYGLTDTDEHVITIDSSLSWNERFAVLAHEGGHTLQRNWYSYQEGDAFAECVSMLVSHDGLREHARYLASFKSSALFVMVTDWRAIYRAADTLEDK